MSHFRSSEKYLPRYAGTIYRYFDTVTWEKIIEDLNMINSKNSSNTRYYGPCQSIDKYPRRYVGTIYRYFDILICTKIVQDLIMLIKRQSFSFWWSRNTKCGNIIYTPFDTFFAVRLDTFSSESS